MPDSLFLTAVPLTNQASAPKACNLPTSRHDTSCASKQGRAHKSIEERGEIEHGAPAGARVPYDQRVHLCTKCERPAQ